MLRLSNRKRRLRQGEWVDKVLRAKLVFPRLSAKIQSEACDKANGPITPTNDDTAVAWPWDQPCSGKWKEDSRPQVDVGKASSQMPTPFSEEPLALAATVLTC